VDKTKERISDLPAGVNQRDLKMFTRLQEATKEFLRRENMGILPPPVDISTTVSKGGPDHGVSSETALPNLPASNPGKPIKQGWLRPILRTMRLVVSFYIRVG
jgi:hypothetical protein